MEKKKKKGKIEEVLTKTVRKRKRWEGAGRKSFNENLEEIVLEWVFHRRSEGQSLCHENSPRKKQKYCTME